MKEPDFKLYYNPYNVIKRGKLINLCNGGRGTGKTFGYKYYTVKDFLDNSGECVWVRRTDAALQEMTKGNGFFKDIEQYFENEFKSDGRTGFVDNKECVHFIPLSQGNKFKSVAFPNVNKLIFDEYIIGAEDNTQHYLRNEVYLFLNLISTVFRDRDNFQVFLLGNFETVDNPYMRYFNVYPAKGQIFTSNNDVLVQQYENKEFEAKQSAYITFKLKKEEEVYKKIQSATKQVLVEQKLDAVLDYRVIFVGGLDITDLVIAKLKGVK